MPVRTWVGRFAIADGQPREDGPYLRSFPRQRPDEEEDELYVLVEPASPASTEHSRQLAEAIGRTFSQDALSMTGAVLRALDAAHQELLEWNARSLPEHRVGAGLSCVAIRGRTAYLAQLGPSVAYHLGDGRVSRLVPEGKATEPLGYPEQIEPLFTRFELSPGDLVLIASPAIDRLLDHDALRAILLKGGDEALVELFRLARPEQDFSLALLACVVEPEAAPEPPPPPPLEPAGAAEAATPADAAAAAQVQPPPAPREAIEAATPEPPSPAAPPAGLTEPKVRLKGADAEIRYLRSTGLASRLPNIPPIAIVAVILLIVVGVIAAVFIPSALQESRDDQFTQSRDEAASTLNAALATSDPAERRELLRTAERALDEAERIQPEAPELADLRAQIASAKIELDAVIELPELELVTDVSEQIPGPVSPKSLALGGGGAYFLDEQQQRVIAVALVATDRGGFVMFAAGDLVAAEITGIPRHIAWSEELGALLIMDDARRLIAVTPPGQPGQLLTVRDAAAWGSPDGIATRGGSLYILDRLGDQVWRYPPSDSGFDSEREPLVAIELEEALELAVGDALYLVIGDDTITRIQGGEAERLSLAGIDKPLVAPASLVPLSAQGVLLVADRGQDRIVVLSLDGRFVQQWVSPTFTDLRAIAVDEANGLLYILVGSALYRTPLPAIS